MEKILQSKAPGRINIIGEHTDYNDGFVLPAAINKATTIQLSKNGSNHTVNFVAKNIGETYSFQLHNISPLKSGWQNYVMGVVAELQAIGAKMHGFDAIIDGDVPLGSGLSSSAALECSLANGLNHLFDLGLDKWQLIKAAQRAEHNMVGTKCGIMDQFASIMGKKDHVLLLDCRSLEYDYIPFDLGDFQILLLNTNVSHSLASSAYNTRRASCEAGVFVLQKTYPTVESLRDVTPKMLQTSKSTLSKEVFDCCKHVIAENERVLAATKALKQRDFQSLGLLMYASHFSLQHDYKVSCAELDFLVQLTQNQSAILGSRMMGGGFGGCTISIVKKAHIDEFIAYAAQAYRQAFDLDLSTYQVSIEDGALIL